MQYDKAPPPEDGHVQDTPAPPVDYGLPSAVAYSSPPPGYSGVPPPPPYGSNGGGAPPGFVPPPYGSNGGGAPPGFVPPPYGSNGGGAQPGFVPPPYGSNGGGAPPGYVPPPYNTPTHVGAVPPGASPHAHVPPGYVGYQSSPDAKAARGKRRPPPHMVMHDAQDIHTTRPALTVCPHCRHQGVTRTQGRVGTCSVVTCTLIFFGGGVLGCCLIPLCCRACQDAEHSCENCGNTVAHVKRC